MATQNLDWMTTPSFTVLFAQPDSGKTHMIEFLIKQLWGEGRLQYGFVFSLTAKMNGDYSYLPQKYIYPKYKNDTLRAILQHQASKGGPKAPPAFIIFDDCLGDTQFNSDAFTSFVSMYRHYNLTVFISTQYTNKVPPIIRDCCTYAFIFKQGTVKSMKALYEAFGGLTFPKWEQWAQFVDEHTQDYEVLIYKKKARNVKTERFMKIKAPAQLPDIEINY